MILALCQLKQRVLFFPISWREEDQVSNNKLTSFGISLLKLCGQVSGRAAGLCGARMARENH